MICDHPGCVHNASKRFLYEKTVRWFCLIHGQGLEVVMDYMLEEKE